MLIGVIAEELLIEWAMAGPINEPVAALDMVDAGLGSLLVEAPTVADAVVDAGLLYGVTVNEAAAALDLPSAAIIILVTGGVSEVAPVDSTQDAAVVAAVAATALIADGMTVSFVTPAFASVSVLGSGTMLTVH